MTTAPARFRKRPVTVEAMRWTGSNIAEIWDWAGAAGVYGPTEANPDQLILTTIHGDRAVARVGDWVIAEPVPDRYYPCKPDVFETTYEPLPGTSTDG